MKDRFDHLAKEINTYYASLITSGGPDPEYLKIAERNEEGYHESVRMYSKFRAEKDWGSLEHVVKILGKNDVKIDSDGFPELKFGFDLSANEAPKLVFDVEKREKKNGWTDYIPVRPGNHTADFKREYLLRLKEFSQRIPKKLSMLPAKLARIIQALRTSELANFVVSFANWTFCENAIIESPILKFICRIDDDHRDYYSMDHINNEVCDCIPKKGVTLLNPFDDAPVRDICHLEKFFQSYHLQFRCENYFVYLFPSLYFVRRIF